MNKTELVACVSDKTNLTKKDAAAAVKAVLETVSEALSAGDKITLMGFGIFEVHDRSARIGRNPRTGQEVKISACKTPAFKAALALKERVNAI